MWKFIPVLIVTFFFHGGNFAYADYILPAPSTLGTVDGYTFEAYADPLDSFDPMNCSTSNWKLTFSTDNQTSVPLILSSELKPKTENPTTFFVTSNQPADIFQIMAVCSDGSLGVSLAYTGATLFSFSGNEIQPPPPPPPPPPATTTATSTAENNATSTVNAINKINTTLQTLAIIISLIASLYLSTILVKAVKS